jgi:hypothetical protein
MPAQAKPRQRFDRSPHLAGTPAHMARNSVGEVAFRERTGTEDHMDGDEDARIRRRAYELWELEGRSGNPEDHWYRAEQDLRSGSTEPGSTPDPKSSPERSPEAQKFADQVEVATKSRKARSKQTGRAGATGTKKKAAESRRDPVH